MLIPLPEVLAAVLEKGLNQALYAQWLPEQRQMLANKRLVVFLDVLPHGITLAFNHKIDVLSRPKTLDEAKAELDANTCIISTRLSVLNRLRDPAQLTSLIQSGELELLGDIAIAQQLSDLARQYKADPEEWLAKRTSDVAAHSFFSIARTAAKTLKSTTALVADQLADLAIEERPVVARKQAVDYFCTAVTQIDTQVNELELRIAKLEQACD